MHLWKWVCRPISKDFSTLWMQYACLKKKEWRNGKTTVLYYKIGEINGVKPQNVEQSIRHAFEATLAKGNPKAVKKYLSFECTTNGSQLHLLYIRLKQQEEEGES